MTSKHLDLNAGQFRLVDRFPYLVSMGRPGCEPRVRFACVAPSLFAARLEYEDMREPGESVRVVPVGRELDFPIASLRHELQEGKLREVRFSN